MEVYDHIILYICWYIREYKINRLYLLFRLKCSRSVYELVGVNVIFGYAFFVWACFYGISLNTYKKSNGVKGCIDCWI